MTTENKGKVEYKRFAQKFPGYEVKGLKWFRGMEGEGYNATIYKGGKKLGMVIDEGCGGAPHFEMPRAVVEAIIVDAKAYDVANGEQPDEMSIETFIGDMICARDIEARLQRAAKKYLVFMLPGDDQGTFRTINRPFSVEMAEKIRAKHPEALVLNGLL